MTLARTTRGPQIHVAARRRACTSVGIPAPRRPADGEATLVDLVPGPTREQLADQVAALQVENAWLRRQLEMRFEVLTLAVMGATFAETSARLDIDCERWPTDPLGTPVDQRAIDVRLPAHGGGQ
jgi:hypothetical protein